MKHLLLSILFTLGFSLQLQAETIIQMDSDAGDWVGAGQEYNLSEETGTFSVSISSSSIVIGYNSSSTSEYFSFRIAAPNNRNFERGVFLDAQRTPFRGPLNPGLEVTGNHRGCNTISGEFFIFEIDSDESNPVLALDFVQHCDSISTALRGSIRINSELQIPYEHPFAVPVLPAFADEGANVDGSSDNTLDGGSSIESYLWQHVSGPVVTFSDASSANPVITLPEDVVLGGEESVVSLTVTNANNDSDVGTAVIVIRSKSDPRTFFNMSGEAGDWVSAGNSWSYDDSNATITASRNYDNGVSVSINGDASWSANFAAAGDVEMTEGVHDPATRFPFQSSEDAGLSVSGNGRGCNQSFGSFEVLELSWENQTPTSFHATFETHCESTTAPKLSGEVGVNVRNKSVPTANAGNDITINEGEIESLNGSESFDSFGEIQTYSWILNSSELMLDDADTSRPVFTAPLLGDRVESQSFIANLLITDDEGYKSEDQVEITVLMNNQAPIVNDDNLNVRAGESLSFAPLVNDSDEDGRLLIDSIEIIDGPSHGTAYSNSSGEINYTHSSLAEMEDSLTYVVTDNDGAVSQVATVTITVSQNNAPTALEDSATVFVGESVNISVLDNDDDSDGQLKVDSIVIVNSPNTGTVSVDSSGIVTYSHSGHSAGLDSFTYTVVDNENAISNVAEVKITISTQPAVDDDSSSGGGSLGGLMLLIIGLAFRSKQASRSS